MDFDKNVGGDVFMNIKRLIFKIQLALNAQGRQVKINQLQTWSPVLKRMVTKYVIIEDGKTILESYKAVEIVQALAGMVESG